MIEECKLCGYMLSCLFCIFLLFLSLSEIIYSGVRYDIYMTKSCSYIWGWTIGGGIIDFFSFVLLCGLLVSFGFGKDERNTKLWAFLQIFQIAPIIVMIWATNTHIKISNHCYDLLSEKAPELFTLVEIHFAMMIISVILFFGFLFVKIPMIIIKSFFRAAGQ